MAMRARRATVASLRGRAMSARSGKQYLAGLREQDREVWLGGERVRDVTTHPGLRNGARAIAALYDMQCDRDLRDVMTMSRLRRAIGWGSRLSFRAPATTSSAAGR
jgi:aromatic ring hydroxylase